MQARTFTDEPCSLVRPQTISSGIAHAVWKTRPAYKQQLSVIRISFAIYSKIIVTIATDLNLIL